MTPTIDYIEPEADHKMRHQRFLRQQLHDIEVSQKALKRQMNEIHHHQFDDRLHSVESELRRLANANFNVSRQVANFDRFHGSMLELLEDVESLQTKFDKTIPDIKREISKVEFNAAQVGAEQRLLREEGHNAAKSIQALAVSVSTLQEERDNQRGLKTSVEQLKNDVQKLQSAADMHKRMFHKRIEKVSWIGREDRQ